MTQTALCSLNGPVLVLERNVFVSHYVASVLEGAGARPVMVTTSDEEATEQLTRLRTLAGAAVGVADGHSQPWRLARLLAKRGVPFVFLFTRTQLAQPEDLRDRPSLRWPFAGYQVVEALAIAIKADSAATAKLA